MSQSVQFGIRHEAHLLSFAGTGLKSCNPTDTGIEHHILWGHNVWWDEVYRESNALIRLHKWETCTRTLRNRARGSLKLALGSMINELVYFQTRFCLIFQKSKQKGSPSS
jgi:hypothetical protein